MSAKTKIIILKKRELLYTILFAALAIIFLVLLVIMFQPTSQSKALSPKSLYSPGVYTTPITLNNNVIDLQVRVDHDHINSISLVNLSESAAAALPLVKPALAQLSAQICASQSTSNIYYEDSSQYTSQMLLKAIEQALNIARS